MKHVLPELISSNQTAYVKNRCISESGRLISDVIQVCDMLDISHNLVTMDIEKVFDSLDHDFKSVFFNILELFSPKKRKLSTFRFRSIFIFNKKETQSCQFATYRCNALFEFLTSQTGQIFKVIMRYLCISLTH